MIIHTTDDISFAIDYKMTNRLFTGFAGRPCWRRRIHDINYCLFADALQISERSPYQFRRNEFPKLRKKPVDSFVLYAINSSKPTAYLTALTDAVRVVDCKNVILPRIANNRREKDVIVIRPPAAVIRWVTVGVAQSRVKHHKFGYVIGVFNRFQLFWFASP